MKQKTNFHKTLGFSFYLSSSLMAFSQLTWSPVTNLWDIESNHWDSGGGALVAWDNTGGQEAIFPDDPALSAVSIADDVIVDGVDFGVNVGNITLTPGVENAPVNLTAVTDNLGLLTVVGSPIWNLGGRELSFTNDQANDTSLAVGTGETLSISGGGEFDTGERPNGADWQVAGATLAVIEPTVVRGPANTIGQFDLVQIAAGSIYIHERNAGQDYPNNWEITGSGNLIFGNRFARPIFTNGIISGTGGITALNLASTDGGGNFLRLNNTANSFEGGLIIDSTNQTSLVIAIDGDVSTPNDGDGVLGAVPASFDSDNIILRNGGRLRLQNGGGNSPMVLNANRGLTLDNGGVIIMNGNDNTLNAPITGAGPLQIGVSADASANILHLDAAGSDYTGGTLIQRGTISPGVANALPSDTVLTLGGTLGSSFFDINGFDQTIGGLTISGVNTRSIRNSGASPASLIIDVADGEAFTYGSNFDQAGTTNIVKAGLGTQSFLRLAGYTTAPGEITVNEGTLVFSVNDSFGAVSVAEGASLEVGHTQTAEPASFSAASGSTTVYNWAINDWAGTPGTGWPLLNVLGDFTIAAGADFSVVISENALANFVNVNTDFVIGSVGAAIDAEGTTFTVDDSGFTSGEGTWSLAVVGQDLVLSYEAAVANAYEAFAANFPGLTGGFADDDDGDGFSNAEEFYFGGSDPTSASSVVTGGPEVTSSTGSGVLVFTHLRPIEASGVNADYEWSRTLEPSFIANGESDGTFTVNIVPGVATPDIAGYEMVTVTVSSAPVMAEKLFARVLLSLIP